MVGLFMAALWAGWREETSYGWFADAEAESHAQAHSYAEGLERARDGAPQWRKIFSTARNGTVPRPAPGSEHHRRLRSDRSGFAQTANLRCRNADRTQYLLRVLAERWWRAGRECGIDRR